MGNGQNIWIVSLLLLNREYWKRRYKLKTDSLFVVCMLWCSFNHCMYYAVDHSLCICFVCLDRTFCNHMHVILDEGYWEGNCVVCVDGLIIVGLTCNVYFFTCSVRTGDCHSDSHQYDLNIFVSCTIYRWNNQVMQPLHVHAQVRTTWILLQNYNYDTI
jgi:hypothetical protein